MGALCCLKFVMGLELKTMALEHDNDGLCSMVVSNYSSEILLLQSHRIQITGLTLPT
jgi:hypothetical protein